MALVDIAFDFFASCKLNEGRWKNPIGMELWANLSNSCYYEKS